MIYEKAIAPGTAHHNLRVERVARGIPLVYRVRCLRPECGGQFEIDHERLVNLGSGWCQWPGCNAAETERCLRRCRPQAMRINRGFDSSRSLEGQESYNLKIQSRVSSLSSTISYWVQCTLCKTQWTMSKPELLSLTGYKCRNVTCRLDMERALNDGEKRSQRQAEAALMFYGV